MKATLYGHAPKTLARTFGIAQTVYYDNQYLHLDQNRGAHRMRDKALARTQQQSFPTRTTTNFNYNSRKTPSQFQTKSNEKPEPMEIDNSNRFKQSTNWRQPEPPTYGQKREYNASGQHKRKMQRINHSNDEILQQTAKDGAEIPDTEHIPDDVISNTSQGTETASALLGE